MEEISWIFPPSLAHFIYESSENKGVSDDMKTLIPDNFRSMRKEWIDDSLKVKQSAALTTEQEERAKQQVEFIFNHDEFCPQVFLEAAEQFTTH